MSKKNKMEINYSTGDHEKLDDTVVITISGTGMKMTNPAHRHQLNIMIKVIATHMLAYTQNVKPENVQF